PVFCVLSKWRDDTQDERPGLQKCYWMITKRLPPGGTKAILNHFSALVMKSFVIPTGVFGVEESDGETQHNNHSRESAALRGFFMPSWHWLPLVPSTPLRCGRDDNNGNQHAFQHPV
ncbi:MAG: hypothetical protein WCH75_26935, partial [Candidatus Binatia bacterium]